MIPARYILFSCFFAIASVSILHAQEERIPIFYELEGGVAWFPDNGVRSVFPAGLTLKTGPSFALGNDARLRLRPQAGVKIFIKQEDSNLMEYLRILKLGGEVSYDAHYAGGITFFPYLSIDYNWVANYDAENAGTDQEVIYSENYIRGSGISQELGLKVQYRQFYIKGGYEFFRPVLRIRRSILEEDLAGGYLTPVSHRFDFNAFNISVGIIL